MPPVSGVLPTRDGVGPSCISLPESPAPGWQLVLDFLAHRFPLISREEIAARMLQGDVLDAGGEKISPAHAYQPHLKLYYYRSIEVETPIPFEETVLFRDDYLLAVDKPHFLPVTPGGRYLQQTLLVRLKRKLGIDTIAPMHRIDRETAGLVLFTIKPETRGIYQQLFSMQAVEKSYQAVAARRDDLSFPLRYESRLVSADHFMRMREEAGVANALTEISILETGATLTRYRLQPRTGKKHQLRVQMAALGMPILNDQIYPTHRSKADIERDDFSQPLQLLAEKISFTDPISGELRRFASTRRLQAI